MNTEMYLSPEVVKTLMDLIAEYQNQGGSGHNLENLDTAMTVLGEADRILIMSDAEWLARSEEA